MKQKISTESVLTVIKNYFFITLGLAVFTFGWSAFLLPVQLMGGGVSGIASLIYFANPHIPVGLSSFVINGIFIAVAWKILGSKFCITTGICTAIVSAGFAVFQPMFSQPLVDDTFMCAIIGSGLAGFGVALALNYGGNTGGTDIIIMIIGKFRRVAYGKLTMYINVFIIASSYLITHSVEKLVYSFVVMIAYTIASDTFLDGHRQTYQFMIFSQKNEEIADQINHEMHRGATLLKGVGSYSKQESDVLLVMAHKSDKTKIMRIIKETDKAAFVSISKTNAVFGKNFDQIQL
ncbi:MAG: YitT family protein [Bacteroidales bacterium]|nr:YitT family protein [Bacteroidales bacterium]